MVAPSARVGVVAHPRWIDCGVAQSATPATAFGHAAPRGHYVTVTDRHGWGDGRIASVHSPRCPIREMVRIVREKLESCPIPTAFHEKMRAAIRQAKGPGVDVFGVRDREMCLSPRRHDNAGQPNPGTT
jgi:hypothetical protein